MQIISTIIVFVQTTLFSFFHISVRRLEERGVSAYMISGLQRYAFIPAVLFLVLVSSREAFELLFSKPNNILVIVGSGLLWVVGLYGAYLMINASNSLSLTLAIKSLINIPIVLIIGVVINHDIPNIYMLTAFVFLVGALLVKPTQDIHNTRKELQYSFLVIIVLIIIKLGASGLSGALYRDFLQVMDGHILFGVAIYLCITTFILNMIYLLVPFFKKISLEKISIEKNTIKKHSLAAYAIPMLWFCAVVFEGYSTSQLPLFTMSALGSFGFLLETFSDIKSKRISLNTRTLVFIGMVIASIVFSVISTG